MAGVEDVHHIKAVAMRLKRPRTKEIVKKDAAGLKKDRFRARIMCPPAFEFDDGSYDFRCFPTQQLAFAYIDKQVAWDEETQQIQNAQVNLNPWRALSFETNASGSRRFVACRWNAFEARYLAQAFPAKRHWYEIIRQDSACRLYFDLEYSTIKHPLVDPEACTAAWIFVVQFVMERDFGLSISRKNILELESSTPEKFSRHLIVHLPGGVLFATNRHAGRFARAVAVEAKNRNFCWLGDTCIADLAVYTRNRCFRLFLSSKFGKSTALTLASDAPFYDGGQGKEFSPKVVLRDSLVTPLSYSRTSKCLCVGTEEDRYWGKGATIVRPPGVQEGSKCFSAGSNLPSPFPLIDEHVLSTVVNGRGGVVAGYIRSWKTSREESVVTYDIGRNRFCSRIGRAHRSNHIYIVVDLVEGSVVQKCYDPSCAGFSHALESLPKMMLEVYQFEALARLALAANPNLP
jgi:hypothetical protein